MLKGTFTFKTRVFVPILLLVLATVSLMGYLYIHRQSVVIERDLEKRGQSFVTVLARNLKVGLLTRSNEYIDEAVKSVVDLDDVLGVRVYDSHGKVLREIGKESNPRQDVIPTIDLFAKDLSSKVFHFSGHVTLVAPVYYVASGIAGDDLELYPVATGKSVVIGFVGLSLTKQSIVLAQKDVRNLGIITALLFCILGGLIAYYIASSVTSPLSDLVKHIRDIKDRGLRNLPLRGPSEIHEVSIAFNMMADTLIKREQELHSMASALSLTEERERRRIAGELHDNIGQTLAVSKMRVGMLRQSLTDPRLLKELNELSELIGQTIRYSRSLMSDLSSPVLFELGLVHAIEALVDETGKKHSLAMNWEAKGEPPPMDEGTLIVLYRAVRELLINVVKHARAREVTVSVEMASDIAKIRVEDDGVGFDVRDMEDYGKALKGSFGLLNMRERLKDIGGTLLVESIPGRGTAATINVQFIKCQS